MDGIEKLGALHVVGGHHIQGAVFHAIILDGDGAQLLPGGDGGLHRLGQVGNQLGQLGVVVGGHGGLNLPRGLGQHIVPLVGQCDGHLAGHVLRVLVQQGDAVEVLKRPLQQPLGFGKGPVVPPVLVHGVLGAQHHAVEGAAQLVHGGGGQTAPRLAGVARLDADGLSVVVADGVKAAQQAVGGVDGALRLKVGGREDVGRGADNGAEGVVLHGRLGHEEDVVSGGVVLRVVEAVGVGEMGVLHAKLLSPGVHPGHKLRLRPAHGLGQNVAGVVAGGQQVAVEQAEHRQLLPRLDFGGGAVPGQVHRLGGGGDDGVQADLARVHRVQHHQGGHNLGDGGGIAPLVGVKIVEHLPVVAVHHDGGLGVGPGVLQGGGGGGEGKGHQDGQKQRKKTIFFHRNLPSSML